MLQFEETLPRPVGEESIIIGGKKVGRIWESKHGFQCQIKVDSKFGCLSLNGIAYTRHAAIVEAISSMETNIEEIQKMILFLKSNM